MEAIITTEWFTRYGTVYATSTESVMNAKVGGTVQFRSGKPYDLDLTKGTAKYDYEKRCSRCGGAGGSDKWAYTGWTCFECGGSGKGGVGTGKLYTAERLAKLDAAQAKRDAARQVKAQAAQEARNAEARAKRQAFCAAHRELVSALEAQADPEREQPGDAFLVDLYRKLEDFGSLTDGQIEAAQKTIDRNAARAAQKAASQFVGEIGQRVTLTLTVDHIIKLDCGCVGRFHTCFGPRSIFLCRDEQGNRVVYKGGNHLADKGDTFRVKATVEAHDDYKGEAQTKIARPKVL